MNDEKLPLGYDSARTRTSKDAHLRTALADGRQAFGRNLRETRLRHPAYKTQLDLARELNALGFRGYSTDSEAGATVVTKKISKFERGTLSPSLPEAAAIARILNTTLDALTDSRGTIESTYDRAEQSWERFTESVVSFYNSFHRANSAMVDFRTAQEELRETGVPLYAPEGVTIWSGLWGALTDEDRASLVEAWNEGFGRAQELRTRSAQRRDGWHLQLKERLDDARQRLHGAALQRSLTNIRQEMELARREEARKFMSAPDRQLRMLGFLDALPETEGELVEAVLGFNESDAVQITLKDEDGQEHTFSYSGDESTESVEP